MRTGVDAFSTGYAQARSRFLEAAGQVGASLESHAHPLPGLEGEALAMDVARIGPAQAPELLIVSSACHGIEGYCGSGVQIDALGQSDLLARAGERGIALLFIHALNPHGFSHGRRVTHENVDLNRNFHDFSQALPVNADYPGLHPLLLPAAWPPDAANVAAIDAWVAEPGLAAFQAAVSRGQHSHPDGLFFGGTAPTWSNRTLRAVLSAHGRQARRIAWIDLHTGLGPSGVGERIFACRNDAAALARARAWWGPQVTSIYDGSSTSAFLTGLMWTAAEDECPQAEYTGLALEYGTEPIMTVMQALRADHWLHLHPEAPASLRDAIRRQVRAAFYTETDTWKNQVLAQAREAIGQALDGLAGPG